LHPAQTRLDGDTRADVHEFSQPSSILLIPSARKYSG
jgi:hypothetical protein